MDVVGGMRNGREAQTMGVVVQRGGEEGGRLSNMLPSKRRSEHGAREVYLREQLVGRRRDGVLRSHCVPM